MSKENKATQQDPFYMSNLFPGKVLNDHGRIFNNAENLAFSEKTSSPNAHHEMRSKETR